MTENEVRRIPPFGGSDIKRSIFTTRGNVNEMIGDFDDLAPDRLCVSLRLCAFAWKEMPEVFATPRRKDAKANQLSEILENFLREFFGLLRVMKRQAGNKQGM